MSRRAALLAMMLVLVLGAVGCEETTTEETITEDTATQETSQDTATRETNTQETITQDDVYAYMASLGEYHDAYKNDPERSSGDFAQVESALIEGGYISEDFADNFVSSNGEVAETLWNGNAVRETGLQFVFTCDWIFDNVIGDSHLEGNTFVMVLSEGNNTVISQYDLRFVWVDGKWMIDDVVFVPAS